MIGDSAADMAAAAAAWLSSLDDRRLALALGGSPVDAVSNEERLRWYYTPTDHGGLALRHQRPRQQGLAMRLVASGLSDEAYDTVCVVMGLENVLDRVEGWAVDWGRGRGRDPGLYWLRVFGDPASSCVWGWRFGGHHISLNYLAIDGVVASTTPSFIGADPAATTLMGGARLRPLGATEDLALALMSSLDREQAGRALLHPRAVSDIVSGNRATVGDGSRMIHMQDLWRGPFADRRLAAAVDDIDRRAETSSGYADEDHERLSITLRPKGLAAHALTTSQRVLLGRLVGTFTGRARRGAANEDLTGVHFGWSGAAIAGSPLYFRVQGPRILAEYDNTQRDANHVHSVWRAFDTDFGLTALRDHMTSHGCGKPVSLAK